VDNSYAGVGTSYKLKNGNDDMNITVKQAFAAMYYLLDKYYGQKKIDDLGTMLGSMNLHLGMPADVAMWCEWVTIVNKVMPYEAGRECLDTNIAFQAILAFLDHYQRYAGLDIQQVIEDLGSEQTGNVDFKKIWLESIEQTIAG